MQSSAPSPRLCLVKMTSELIVHHRPPQEDSHCNLLTLEASEERCKVNLVFELVTLS